MTERVRCSVAGCDRWILPATAETTGGPCMPCHQGRRARERSRPAPIDRFAGLSDPAEILRRYFDAPPPDGTVQLDPPEPLASYAARLTPAQQRALRDATVALVRDGARRAGAAAEAVACWTEVDLLPLQQAMLAREPLLAPCAFVGASAEVRDDLLARLERSGADRRVPEALAWCGDDVVVARFAGWRRERPQFWQASWGAVDAMPHAAGWELDERDQRRELVDEDCVALVPPTSGTTRNPRVRVAVPGDARCPRCGHPLHDLLRVDEPRGVLPIPFCRVCAGGAYLQHGRYDGKGGGVVTGFDPHSVVVDDPFEPLAADPLVAGRSRSPRHALSWGLRPRASQLGGHPTWIQHPHYPECPSCRRAMPFVGQVEAEELDDAGEGIYHAFACRGCRATAVTYECS